MIRTTRQLAAALALALAAGVAGAHGEADHRKTMSEPLRMEQKAWGIAGDAGKATRTIEIRMSDRMRFTPDKIEVREGETVRLVHRNGGKVMHEFVLGTKQVLDEHAALMLRFPDMEHDEPYMAHVGPGKTGEIAWTFNRAGEFDFACLIPGHYQAGMVGKIRVVAQ
ncbi:MAG: cupredoxin family protein [Rubrivivax sp.]|nr:cupredoxin family protein [Rubrivivax sp.]